MLDNPCDMSTTSVGILTAPTLPKRVLFPSPRVICSNERGQLNHGYNKSFLGQTEPYELVLALWQLEPHALVCFRFAH